MTGGGTAADPEPLEQAARALVYEGGGLMARGQLKAAIHAFDQVVERWGDAPDVPLRLLVATALLSRAGALDQQGRSKQANAAYQELIRRYGDAKEPELQGQVAGARLHTAADLLNSGQPAAAIEVYDLVVERCGQSPELEMRIPTAAALAAKAVALEMQGRLDEAGAVYDMVEQRYRDAPEPGLREIVTTARRNRSKPQGHLVPIAPSDQPAGSGWLGGMVPKRLRDGLFLVAIMGFIVYWLVGWIAGSLQQLRLRHWNALPIDVVGLVLGLGLFTRLGWALLHVLFDRPPRQP